MTVQETALTLFCLLMSAPAAIKAVTGPMFPLSQAVCNAVFPFYKNELIKGVICIQTIVLEYIHGIHFIPFLSFIL